MVNTFCPFLCLVIIYAGHYRCCLVECVDNECLASGSRGPPMQILRAYLLLTNSLLSGSLSPYIPITSGAPDSTLPFLLTKHVILGLGFPAFRCHLQSASTAESTVWVTWFPYLLWVIFVQFCVSFSQHL